MKIHPNYTNSFEVEKTRTNDYFGTSNFQKNIKKQAFIGVGATVIARISTYTIQMIGTVALARILSPDDFGLVAMITVITIILIEFGILRLNDAVIQRKDINHKQISTLFWINFFMCFTLAGLLMLLSPFVAWFYKEPKLGLVTIVLSTAFIFNGLSVQHLALLQRRMQFYKFATIQILASLISNIVALIIALYSRNYWALVTKHVVLAMVTTAGAWILCSWRPGQPSLGTGVRPMILFGLNSLGNYTMNYFCRSFDKILVGRYLGTQPLGYYERAYHLFVMPVNQLTFPLTNVAVATLSRLNHEPEKFHRYYLNAVSMIALVGMPLSAILTLVGKDFIILLLGAQWHEAGRIFTLFGPGIGIMLIYGTHGWLHLSLGKANRWFRWGIFAFIVTFLFFIAGIRFGAKGVAVAYTASFYILIFPGLWYAGKPIGIKLITIINRIWKFFTAALISGTLVGYLVYQISTNTLDYNKFQPLIKITLPATTCLILYFLIVIILHRSFQPILHFLSLLRDIFPIRMTQKSKTYVKL